MQRTAHLEERPKTHRRTPAGTVKGSVPFLGHRSDWNRVKRSAVQREERVVTQPLPSWNEVREWLLELRELRSAFG